MEVKRIGTTLDNLLDISRIKSGSIDLHLEEGCLAGILKDIVDRHELTAREGAITTELVAVSGRWDRSRVAQVVAPILSNAVKFGMDKPIEIALVATSGSATISVTDHGIGMEPSEQASLFSGERMNLAGKNPEPALGLWMAGQLVQAMGGNVAVRSRPGEGSTFFVTLPRRLSSGAA
jgi:signal transduction histidine kinase